MVMVDMDLRVKIPVKVGAEQLLNITCTIKIIKVKYVFLPVIECCQPSDQTVKCASEEAVSPSNQFYVRVCVT